MSKLRSNTKRVSSIPPPPELGASYEEVIAYHKKYSLDELEKAGYVGEVPAEELEELEASAAWEIEKRTPRGLAKEYPKTRRQRVAQFKSRLKCVPGLKPAEQKAMAVALDQVADKARDLDEIIGRLLQEEHEPQEIGELLLACQLTLEKLRYQSHVLEDSLFESIERLKKVKPSREAPVRARIAP